MQKAIVPTYQRQLDQTPVGRKYIISEPEIRRSVVIVLQRQTKRQLADATETTIEGARHWVNGTRIPDLTSIINLARSLPEVRAWLYEQIESGDRAAQSFSQDAVTEALVRTLNDPHMAELLREKLGFIDRRLEQDRERARGGK